MIADVVGRFAVSDLPENFTFVHVDRADASVRRLDEGETLNGKDAGNFGGARRRSAIGAGIRARAAALADSARREALDPAEIAG